MVVRCKLKIPSLGITVRHHSAILVMPNSYPCNGIFNPHLTTIKDSYILRKWHKLQCSVGLCDGKSLWAVTWQNQQNVCAHSKDSDQPGHPPSLIRVFAVCMKKAWVLSYPLSTQRRLWSDWVDAQADLSLRWAHRHFVGFVMSRLLCSWRIPSASDRRPLPCHMLGIEPVRHLTKRATCLVDWLAVGCSVF